MSNTSNASNISKSSKSKSSKNSSSSNPKDVFNSHKLITFTRVFAKCVEVLLWIATAAMLLFLFVSFMNPELMLTGLESIYGTGEELTSFGFSIIPASGESLTGEMLVAFGITSSLLCGLMAMIFRNAYLILKTADGKTWFAKSNTPFQANIVRMLREIGIFLIAHSIVSTIAVVAIALIFPTVELSAGNISFSLGLLMLCLSQFFNYGTKLENDTKGLI